MAYYQNQATASLRRIPIYITDSSGVAATGLTFTAAELKVSKNGAAEASSAGIVTEIGSGQYYYEATVGEFDTLGFLLLRVNKTGYDRRVWVNIDATVVAETTDWTPTERATILAALAKLDVNVSTRNSITPDNTIIEATNTLVNTIMQLIINRVAIDYSVQPYTFVIYQDDGVTPLAQGTLMYDGQGRLTGINPT